MGAACPFKRDSPNTLRRFFFRLVRAVSALVGESPDVLRPGHCMDARVYGLAATVELGMSTHPCKPHLLVKRYHRKI